MWKSLLLLANLASLLIIVSSNKGKLKDTHTIITTYSNANSSADTNASSGNGSASAAANAGASVTTIIKTQHHTMKKCAKHEKYVKCPARLCQPQVCEHVGFPLCSAHDEIYSHAVGNRISHDGGNSKDCQGPPACVCIDDYVRNDEGVCIPVTECPACGNDKNATFGCGVNCGRRCSNYNKQNVSCPDNDVCYVNSCDCKDNYVLDDNTGKCVLPQDCSNQNAPDPEGGEGTPGNGEPQEGGEDCDNCNGDCNQPSEMNNGEMEENEIDEDGSQSQCASENTDEEESPSEPDEGDEEETEDAVPIEEGENEGSSAGGSQNMGGLTTTETDDTQEPEATPEGSDTLTTTREQRTTKKREDMSSGDPGSEDHEGSSEGSGMESSTRRRKTTEGQRTTPMTSGGGMSSEDPDSESSEATSESADGDGSDGTNEITCSGDPNAMPGCDRECKNRCPGKKPKKCRCPENSCRCKEGYVYNPATYKCVTIDECGAEMATRRPTDTTDESGSNMKSTTRRHRHRTTARSPSGSMSSKDPGSEDQEGPSEGSNMESTTRRHRHRTTARSPSGGMSSKEPGSEDQEGPSEGSNMESTTRRHRRRTTARSPSGGMSSKDPGSEDQEGPSEGSNMESTTREQRTTMYPRTTTMNSGEDMTTQNPSSNVPEVTQPTDRNQSMKPQTSMTESSKATEASVSQAQSTTEPSAGETTTRRRRRSKKPRTTRSGDGMMSTAKPRRTRRRKTTTSESGMGSTTRKPRRSRRPRTTTSSTAGNSETMITEGQSTRGPSTSATGGSSAMSSSSAMMSTTSNPETCEEVALQLYARANVGFTVKLLTELSLQNVGNNVLCAGSSIMYLLAQLGLGATGNALDQLLGALNLDIDQIKCLLPKLYANITLDSPNTEYNMMSNILADDECPLDNTFRGLLDEVFQIQPMLLDLSNVLSAKTVSDTVSRLTNNGILNFVKSDLLSTLSSLVLLDAQSFKGEWERKFDPRDTTEMDFQGLNDRVVKKPMMYQSGRFLYADSKPLGCKIIKLKFKGGDFSLAVFLPNAVDGINDLLKKLMIVDTVSVLQNLLRVNLDIYLPRINVAAAVRLRTPIIRADVDAIFNTNNSGLLDVATCDTPVVSDVLQRVSISIDELGTGDATDIEFNGSDEPSNPRQRTQVFKANRPFVYCLCYRNIVLFAGLYVR